MKINIVNNVPEINVTVQKSNDDDFSILVERLNLTAELAPGTPLGKIEPGNVVKIGKREYIVLDHSAETTAVIEKDCAKKMYFGKDNNYINSDIRKYCEGKYYEELAKAVGKENIIEHTVKLMAGDGTGKKDTVKANVSILTADLYRRYREFLPKCSDRQWTATRASADDSLGYNFYVYYVNPDGILSWWSCNLFLGVRPFCILNSSILVS